MKPVAIFLFLVSVLLLSRCYYDSEEFLYPDTGNACDTTNVTYTQSVVPILQSYCLSCHSNAAAPALGGNVKLQDYAEVKARADDGKLVGTMSHAQGYVPMPQGAAKLSDCTISTIEIWVRDGAAQ
jgi:hypothetical protein